MENFGEGVSGNVTLSISDHLAQFLIIPHSTDQGQRNHHCYTRDTKNFDRENFILDFLHIDWIRTLKIDQNDPDLSFNSFFESVDKLVIRYLPLRKVTKKEIRHQLKPWITDDIKNLIRNREKLRRKYIQAKDSVSKDFYNCEYKRIRNQIVNLCRVSKKEYYEEFFLQNANNMKSTWEGINNIVKIKGKNGLSHQPLW